MILKGSSRANGSDLAVHLMRTDENEHVRIHELRGFVGDNLHDAFREAEAISRATKCQKYLFSLSLNPPHEASPTAEYFVQTADRIEEKLGLNGQPRALVFHEKEGRRHAHVVWGRIDVATMTAREMDFFKLKLRDVSRELYLENGWQMPRGLLNSAERNPTNFSRAEWEQAKRLGQDPRWTKQLVQDCWRTSDNAKALRSALEARGFILAQGDRRGHVVVDTLGGVHALPRMLDLKAKEVLARLGDPSTLPSVDEARKLIGERMTPRLQEHITRSRAAFSKRTATLSQYKAEMTQLHRVERAKMAKRQDEQRQREIRERQARLPRGMKALWYFVTGKGREIKKHNELEAKASAIRQAEEHQALVDRQLTERRILQTQIKDVRQRQADQLRELRRDVARYLSMSKAETPRADRSVGMGLKLER